VALKNSISKEFHMVGKGSRYSLPKMKGKKKQSVTVADASLEK
jgi:hypothetical protein